MVLHRELGRLFGIFCSLMFGWHILTPGNPDHITNLFLHSSLAMFFLASSFAPVKFARYGHPIVLAIASVITMAFGNFPVGAVIAFVSFFLYFAYGGFRTISTVKVIASFLTMFSLFFVSISLGKFYGSYAEAYAMALVWTSFSIGLFWFFWLILQYFAADIVQQNRDLLELTKELTKGDCNVTKKRG